ncbi:MAG TPA: PaaI family thioesterase [Thermodesulfobacteriota bacterium]|nr:PaaI family thioesterase [Thermodesulfobacteriota bacterium]
MRKLSESELKNILLKNLPAIDQHGEVVGRVGNGEVRLRLPFRKEYLGADEWGNTGSLVFSGPMVMGFAHTAMYGCIHAALGRDVIPIVATLSITFLRPVAAADLIADARIIRRGKRLVYLETYLYSEGDKEPIGHVTSTYAIRFREPS